MALRLFYGLKIPIESVPNLKTAVGKLKKEANEREWDLKFTPLENLHVTVRYLGNQNETSLGKLSQIGRLIADRHEPFTLDLSGLGAFAEVHEARVIWVGTQNKKALQALHLDLDNELKDFKLEAEGPYVPHLTIARLRNTRSVKDYISPFVRKDFGKVLCTELALFKSELRGNFPHYEVLDRYMFKAAPSPL